MVPFLAGTRGNRLMSESDWAVSVARDRAEQITAMRAAGFDVGVRPLRRLNEELMSAPPAIALQLGVRGLDESATEQRRFLADKLQGLAVADFAQGHGQVAALEPSAPFGLALIRAHRGDLAGALGSPYATAQMNIEMRRYFDNNGWVQDQGEWVMAQPPRLDTMLQGRELFKQAVTFTIEDALSGTDQPRVPANPWAYLDRNGVAAPTRNRYAIPAPVWETVTPRPPSHPVERQGVSPPPIDRAPAL